VTLECERLGIDFMYRGTKRRFTSWSSTWSQRDPVHAAGGRVVARVIDAGSEFELQSETRVGIPAMLSPRLRRYRRRTASAAARAGTRDRQRVAEAHGVA